MSFGLRLLKNELEKEVYRVDAIYLFGSYAKRDHLKSSDIDMPVISEDFREIPFMERLDIVNRIVWKKNLGNGRFSL